MNRIDKAFRMELVNEVRLSVMRAMETYDERWLTDDQLVEHIGIMTKRWLREHGDMLPRTRVNWTDGKGQQHTSSWMYPLHRIQAMIEDGRISRLKVSSS